MFSGGELAGLGPLVSKIAVWAGVGLLVLIFLAGFVVGRLI
jgi:hypothetical protein